MARGPPGQQRPSGAAPPGAGEGRSSADRLGRVDKLASATSPLHQALEDLVAAWLRRREMAPMGFLVQADTASRCSMSTGCTSPSRMDGSSPSSPLRPSSPGPGGSCRTSSVPAGDRPERDDRAPGRPRDAGGPVGVGGGRRNGDPRARPPCRPGRPGPPPRRAPRVRCSSISRACAASRPWPAADAPGGQSTSSTCRAGLRPHRPRRAASFCPGALLTFGLRTLLRGPTIVVRLLAALLVPWTVLLALAEGWHFPAGWVRWIPGWPSHPPRRRTLPARRAVERPALVGFLLAAVGADALVTLGEVLGWNLPRLRGWKDGLVSGIAVAAPGSLAFVILGRARVRRHPPP